MGVDCSAKLAFGVALTSEEVEEVLSCLGVEYEHDEPEFELADKYGLNVETIGSHYSGHVRHIIGPNLNFDSNFGGADADASVNADMKGCWGLKKLLKDLSEHDGEDAPEWSHRDPKWHVDTLWW
jgi:hypothetical protein